jgi:GNAT superfamily N-acetyltransferase
VTTSADEYVARRPSRGDEEALARFAQKIWPRTRPAVLGARWWWNAPREPQAWVVEHRPSQAIVALCAARETQLEVRGHRYAAASIGDWYVSPDHSGKGLGRMLVTESSRAHAVMYTTSISEHAATSFSRLGWRGNEALPLFMAPTPLMATLGARDGKNVELRFDDIRSNDSPSLDDLDGLWGSDGPHAPIGVPRNAAHVLSHVALVPHRTYRLLRTYRHGRLTGFGLWRILAKRSFRGLPWLRIGLLSDYYVAPSDLDTFRALVAAVSRALIGDGCAFFLALSTQRPHMRALTGMGCASPTLPLLGKWLGRLSSRSMHSADLDLGRFVDDWHVTFADNDMDLGLGSAAEARE